MLKQEIVDSLEILSKKFNDIKYNQLFNEIQEIKENLFLTKNKFDSSYQLFKIKFTDNNENGFSFDEIKSFHNEIIEIHQYILQYFESLKQIKDYFQLLSLAKQRINDSLAPIEQTSKQFQIILSVKDEINDLTTNDDEIEQLEKQIKELKTRRDEVINNINNEVMANMGVKRDQQSEQIIQLINSTNERKDEIENNIISIKNDLNSINDEIIKLGNDEMENVELFSLEISKIETKLLDSRSKLESVQKIDLGAQSKNLKITLNEKTLEYQRKQKELQVLKLDLNQAQNQKNVQSKLLEIRSLENSLEEAKEDLKVAPSLEIFTEVSNFLENVQLFSKDRDNVSQNNPLSKIQIEISKLEKDIINSKNEIQAVYSKIKNVEFQIDQNNLEYSKFNDKIQQIINSKDNESLLEILKLQKNEINDDVLHQENEISKLEKEKGILASRIHNLKKEKEKMINHDLYNNKSIITTNHKSKNKKYKNKLQNVQKILLHILMSISNKPIYSLMFLIYLLLLHSLILYMFVL